MYFTEIKRVVSEANGEFSAAGHRDGAISVLFNSPVQVEIPTWSGIKGTSSAGTILSIYVDSGSSPYEGVEDRLKTLYKAHLLSSNVQDVLLASRGYITKNK